MIRRRSAVLAAMLAVTTLSSCATFNRNDVAASVGGSKLSAKAATDLLDPTSQTSSGNATRAQLTKWITVTALESAGGGKASPPRSAADLEAQLAQLSAKVRGPKVNPQYDSGARGSSIVCLAAIPVASAEDASKVVAAVTSGTSFADAASKYSIDQSLAQSGGVLTGQDGSECFPTSQVPATFLDPLTGVPAGTPVAASIGGGTAVLVVRPFAELRPESQALLASSSVVAPGSLQAIIGDKPIYVDPRYGRWDPATGSVVPLTS